MKKVIKSMGRIALSMILALSVSMCGLIQTQAASGASIDISGSVKLKKPQNTSIQNPKILFIGNSFTAKNNFTGMVKALSKAGGYSPQIDAVTHGRYTLDWFADETDVYGEQVYQKLKTQKWDYVVLQERSYSSMTEPKAMKKSIAKLMPYIKAAGAQPVLLMTWAPAAKHPDYRGRFKGISRKQYQTMVAQTYLKLGESFDALVSPAGMAFWQYDQQKHGVNLYASDYTHPSKAGSYLSACVLYATLYQQSPEGLSAGYVKDAATAKGLQQMAAQLVLGKGATSGGGSEQYTENVKLKIGNQKILQSKTLENVLLWTSDNSQIASVDQSGLVTAKKTGVAFITATGDTGAETYVVAVNPPRVVLGYGETYNLGTKRSLGWESSNEKVASVKKGVITARKTGTAVLTAYGPGNSKLTCKVRVKKAPNKINVKVKKVLKAGHTFQLRTIFPKGSYSSKMKYKSSDTAVAKVDRSGVVTAISKGTVVITATAYNGVKSKCEIRVK